jgi:2-methylisocitrate lyase-like PEP mutase family enzyme
MGIYDVFSASIASRYFDAVFLSGYGFTASHYGLPDEGYVTWNDIVDFTARVRAILRSAHIIVDIDDGYGDEKISMNVVRRLEQAGASAVILEDQKRPKKCGHLPGKEILPTATYLRRLEALLDVRRDLFIVARTDASFQEGLVRAQAYAKAGADAVMVEGLTGVDQVAELRERIPEGTFLTVNLIRGGKTPPVTLSDLDRHGANLVIYSTPCLFPVQQTIEDAMQRMLDNNCVLDDSYGRVQLKDNNQILLDNRMRAGLESNRPVRPISAIAGLTRGK